MLILIKTFLIQHRPAIFIANVFLVLGLIYSAINPLFESLDEVWHYPFVWQLSHTWELPVQDPANVQLWRQEGSQPPLYYALVALLTSPIPSDDLPKLIYYNPHADLGIVTADGNINMIIHSAKEAWPWQGAVLAAHVSRLLSLLISTGSVLTIYAVGYTLWPQRPAFALFAMSYVAFNPMFLFVSASVNNDNLVTLLASLVIWRLLVLVVDNKPPSLWQFVTLGLLIGLAALAKFSGLGLLGLTGLTLLGWGWRWRSWRSMILGNGIVVVTTAAIAGWWYWRNFKLYGDWSGTQNMIAMMGPRGVSLTIGQLWAEVPGMMRSFWGLFGGLSVAMPAEIYWLLNLVLIVGLAGLPITLLGGRSEKIPPRLQKTWPILLGWIFLMIIGLIQWTLRTPATQGRLLFPALAALVPLWAAGWMAIFPSRWHFWPIIVLFMVAVWVPWGLIKPTYARPEAMVEVPASAQPLEAVYGEAIELIAYEGKTTTEVNPGQTLALTLYWRGQQAVDTDYSVFIHLIDEHNLIVAQRDVFHGLGLYPSSQWNSQTQFSDTYTLRIPRSAYAPSSIHFGVGLYDHKTGKRLALASGNDMVHFGEVAIRSPAGDVPNPQSLDFEDGISLVGYKLDKRQASPDESIKLTLYWQGKSKLTQNYKVFVHLVTVDDMRAAQHDSEPQGGAAPTSTWTRGQVISDEHPLTINSEAPLGAYQIKVGLYDGETGRRLRLLRDNGISVQADSVTLGGVQITMPYGVPKK